MNAMGFFRPSCGKVSGGVAGWSGGVFLPRALVFILSALWAGGALFSTAQACRIIDPRPIEPLPRPVPQQPIQTREHRAEIEIDDQTASVTVEAVFYNPNPFPMEGTYFFPLPASVAVDRFSMWMNGREVKAELLDADRARRVYEDIVRRARDPGLLEFVGMQMIKVRVFPIPAQGEVKVRLSYAHLVRKDMGLYELSYPFSSAKTEDASPIGSAAIRVRLKTRAALKNLYSPTHPVDISRTDETRATVGFEAREVRPERDFQLYWGTSDQGVGVNVLTLTPPGEDDYALFLIAPPVEPEGGETVARDVVFVLDRSGSMQHNDKIGSARRALRYCLEKLSLRDRFHLLTFATSVDRFRDGLVEATPENRKAALAFLDKVNASGGTAIDEAL
ncbi:MAG: VIT and VWA domain-containing protein, partial [Planctomycetota bacterium]